ncbi:guanine nucleotide-binding protein subunit alpha-14-like [Styela clava]|uniref:guanine nucleotide-binding protein subunit alpha-14-like n=1 Tax=Styela clava TaxID=7725 RepID=UPI00193A03B9|nr:guanine nucleotide-binding protein subunit alpha-14-like [Styela clava]
MSSLVSCLLGRDDSSAKQISRQIEQQLKDDKKTARTQVKLLVLGTSESGKSTFLKQMRIIHGTGYSDEERLTFVSLIAQNIHSSMRILIKSMKYLNISFEKHENEEIAFNYEDSEAETETSSSLSLKTGNDFAKLWNDAGVQQCFARRDEFQLSDSTAYFMNNLERISEKGYIPSLQDVLRSRMPTSGIREYQFDIGNFVFGIVDVGGQKSERRKWIHCFENVTSIIFLAALSEYNMTIPLEEVSQDLRASLRHNQRRQAMRAKTTLNKAASSTGFGFTNGLAGLDMANGGHHGSSQHRKIKSRPSNRKHFSPTDFPRTALRSTPSSLEESPDQNGNTRKKSDDSSRSAEPSFAPSHINRMKESRALFKTIISCEYFTNTSVILFLNKKDILAEKIATSHISDHFPEFEGPKCDAEAARNFILTKYADCFERRRTPKRDLYAHFTCATDTRNIKYVFAAVKDIILKNYLITYNLV